MNIILVEDQIDNIEAAKVACDEAGVHYLIADNDARAQWLLDHASIMEIDGVITDIFMPYGGHRVEADEPCGVAVALRAESLGLPFVFCTSGRHHGPRYHWICMLGRSRGWPEMVSCENEESAKNWPMAIEKLRKIVKKNGVG